MVWAGKQALLCRRGPIGGLVEEELAPLIHQSNTELNQRGGLPVRAAQGGPCTTRCAGMLPAAMTSALGAPSRLILPKS